MDIDDVAKLTQKCIESNPTIVLGSGASIPHGIPGTQELSDYLLRSDLDLKDEKDQAAWDSIQKALRAGEHLEGALSQASLPASLVRSLVRSTWSLIAGADKSLFVRAALGEETLPLTNLLHQLSRSTNTTLHIVTPNYDRVAEYAVDLSGMTHVTGFLPGYIRRREGSERLRLYRGHHPQRTVRIWKVHGSLDWFEDSNGLPVSLPLDDLPAEIEPLIVTPGVSKFERTHDEPFRSVIQGADSALQESSGVLCVGYGFRDVHIQPKLVERCRMTHVPVVILARTLTEEAKHFMANHAGDNFLALESAGDATRFYTKGNLGGESIDGSHFWALKEFNKLAF